MINDKGFNLHGTVEDWWGLSPLHVKSFYEFQTKLSARFIYDGKPFRSTSCDTIVIDKAVLKFMVLYPGKVQSPV